MAARVRAHTQGPPPHADSRDLVDGIRSLSGAAITASERYLGVDVGPGSDETQWQTLVDKVMRRARDIRATSAVVPAKIALFNIHVVEMTRYRAQFANLNATSDSAYRRVAHVILATPYMALPPQLLQGMRKVVFPTTWSRSRALPPQHASAQY